jgi:YHS domain-containing protein
MDMGEAHMHTPGATVCPVSGHDVDPAKVVTVTYEGREIQLCCQDCVEPFNNEPAKYMAILDAPEDPHAGHNH